MDNSSITIRNIEEVLDNDDLEQDYKNTHNKVFPSVNEFGQKLFDANGNKRVSEKDRKLMINQLEEKFSEILDILMISKNDPNVTQTPERLAKMYVNELLTGRFIAPPKLTVFPNRKHVDELIISKGIEVMSLCSHHFQPISGVCSVAYIPDNYVNGLSKMTRIVDWFSRRAQIQEELGEQIADYLENLLKPKALGVVIKAKHYCMIARGVKGSEDKSIMITSVMRGYLREDLNLRNEFLNLIGH